MKKSTLQIIENTIKNHPLISYLKENMLQFIDLTIKLHNSKNKILLCGNGGSCSDCEHFSAELNKSFMIKRDLPNNIIKEINELYPEEVNDFSKNLQQAIGCIPLPSFISFNTAFNNDYNPEFAFAQLLYSLGIKNDMIICFSTSGNSKNVINAAKIAKILNINVVSFTNFDGGELKKYSNILFNVPTDTTYIAQEFHIVIYHALCLAIENELFF